MKIKISLLSIIPVYHFFYFLMLYTLCTKNLLNVLFVEDIPPLSGLCVIPFRLDVAALIIDNAFAAQKPRGHKFNPRPSFYRALHCYLYVSSMRIGLAVGSIHKISISCLVYHKIS
jgi:hypothetical protein